MEHGAERARARSRCAHISIDQQNVVACRGAQIACRGSVIFWPRGQKRALHCALVIYGNVLPVCLIVCKKYPGSQVRFNEKT